MATHPVPPGLDHCSMQVTLHPQSLCYEAPSGQPALSPLPVCPSKEGAERKNVT